MGTDAKVTKIEREALAKVELLTDNIYAAEDLTKG